MTLAQKILVGSFSTVFVIGGFAGLTKAGYIPNFLDIELLCSESEEYENLGGFGNEFGGPVDEKPVIYLYPEEQQEVEVRLEYKGDLFATYPEYNEERKGWKVLASPNGNLINEDDQKEYSYLFWEGNPEKKIDWDLSTGFVVKGSDTKKFLQEKLAKIGLTPREYNEFIVYWFPKMQDNPYNIIHFAQEQYTDTAPLTITPVPDSMLRVFMVFKPLDEAIILPEQSIEPFERKGFSVIEWGGSELVQ